MKKKKSALRRWPVLLLLCAFSGLSFFAGCHSGRKPLGNVEAIAKRKIIIEKYPKIPHDEILQQIAGNRLYGDLEERYKQSLSALKTAAGSDCAKLVVIIMSPEAGKYTTLSNRFGIPFIVESCNQLGIDCINLLPDIGAKVNADPEQIPDDGNWSKAGAATLAGLLKTIVDSNSSYRSSKVFPQSGIPATFGDLPPKDDEVIEGDKGAQYRLTVNSQGLRMNHDIAFPKTKQNVLFLGGTQLYSPYLDNSLIATNLLQQLEPGKEIINAGNLNYTLDDFVSMYQEKTRYTQPDVIFLCTNGDDILNFFFSQRNKYSRLQKIFAPTDEEKQFYEQTFN